MNKIEFYEKMLETLRDKVSEGNMKEHEGLRGNLAYYCDICKQAEYENIIQSLQKMSVNDYCWTIYLTLYNHVIEQELSEEQRELIESEFVATKVLYRLRDLGSFECVFSKDFPEWFFIKEELDRIKNL